MPRLGMSVEQQASVKRLFLFGSILAVVGVVLGVFLGTNGNTGGWLLCALIALIWGTAALFLRMRKADRP
ncbi:hypothetical protein AB0B15_24595 [Streptomyces sp. NPDC045456]|uniref:hypothetical protein n=1 Tax=Streptomyces sp. NPDC045456 TaxID=3155254 RepID=UPI0033F928CD